MSWHKPEINNNNKLDLQILQNKNRKKHIPELCEIIRQKKKQNNYDEIFLNEDYKCSTNIGEMSQIDKILKQEPNCYPTKQATFP